MKHRQIYALKRIKFSPHQNFITYFEGKKFCCGNKIWLIDIQEKLGPDRQVQIITKSLQSRSRQSRFNCSWHCWQFNFAESQTHNEQRQMLKDEMAQFNPKTLKRKLLFLGHQLSFGIWILQNRPPNQKKMHSNIILVHTHLVWQSETQSFCSFVNKVSRSLSSNGW